MGHKIPRSEVLQIFQRFNTVSWIVVEFEGMFGNSPLRFTVAEKCFRQLYQLPSLLTQSYTLSHRDLQFFCFFGSLCALPWTLSNKRAARQLPQREGPVSNFCYLCRKLIHRQTLLVGNGKPLPRWCAIVYNALSESGEWICYPLLHLSHQPHPHKSFRCPE